MKSKSKMYLYEFELYVPQSQIHLKFPCTLFLTWTQAKNSITTKQQPTMLSNNIINFNARLRLSCEIAYDSSHNLYEEKISNLFVYLTSIVRPNEQPKLAGFMKVDLAKCLNTSEYDVENKYQLERCPDKNSSVTFSLRGVRIREIIAENINEKQFSQLHQSLERSSSSRSLARDEDTPTFRLLNSRLNHFEHRFHHYNSAGQSPKPLQNNGAISDNRTDEPIKIEASQYSSNNQKTTQATIKEKQKEGISLVELMTKCQLLDKQLRQQKEAKAVISEENKKFRFEIHKMQTQRSDLNLQLAQFKKAKEELERVVQNNEANLISFVSQKDKKNSERQKELFIKIRAQSQEQIQNYKQKINELQSQLSPKQSDPISRPHAYLREKENTDLKHRLTSAENRIKLLFEQNTKLSQFERRAQQFDIQRMENFKSTKLFQNIIEDQTTTIKQLEQTLKTEREKTIDLEMKLTTVESKLNEKHKLYEKKNQELNRMVYAQEKLAKDLKYYEDKEEILKRNLEELEASSGNLINQLRSKGQGELELQNLIQSLQDQLSESKAQLAFMKHQFEQRQNLIKIFEQDLNDIKDQNHSLQLQVENLQKQFKDLTIILIKQKEQKAFLQASLIQTRETANLYRKQLDQSYRNNRKIESKQNRFEGNFQGLESLVAQLRKQLQTSRSETAALRFQIRSRQVAIRQLQHSMISFVHQGHIIPQSNNKTQPKNDDQMQSEKEPEMMVSVVSSIMNSYQQQLVDKLKKQVRVCRAEIEQLNQELFAQSSISNEAEIRYEELNQRHKALQKQLKLYQKRFESMSKSIEQLSKQNIRATQKEEIGQNITRLKATVKNYELEIQNLKEKEKQKQTELKVLKEEFFELRNQICSAQEQIRQFEATSSKISFDEEVSNYLKQVLELVRSKSEFQIFRVKELQVLTVNLVNRNKLVMSGHRALVTNKISLQTKLLELSKQLQRYKTKCLMVAIEIDHKRQVILNIKPVQNKIEEIKAFIQSLLNGTTQGEQFIQYSESQHKSSKITPKDSPKVTYLFRHK